MTQIATMVSLNYIVQNKFVHLTGVLAVRDVKFNLSAFLTNIHDKLG